GVSVDESEMVALRDASPELFYEKDADVHVMDPNYLLHWLDGYDRTDIDRIEKNVAPFFGNQIDSHAFSWHDYRYYTMYEAFEKLAGVFQQQERYEAFATLHEEFNGPSKSTSHRRTSGHQWRG